MAKKFWITRDTPRGMYEIWADKPHWNGRVWCGGDSEDVCSSWFESLTGIHLDGGSRSIACRRLVK